MGTKLILEDFTLEQVQTLHQRYGTPLNDANLKRFFDLTHGQPYLVRRGLNEIVAHGLQFEDFMNRAEHGDGPFGDHLRRTVMLLNKQPVLVKVVKDILNGNVCPDEDSFYRLRGLGVLQGESKHNVRLRCELYAHYFQKYLT